MSLEEVLARIIAVLPAPLQRIARFVDPAFIRFGFVGGTGFVVDWIGLTLLVHFAHWTPYNARYLSFAVAVVATWALNRSWTFKRANARPSWREVGSYVTVQVTGGIANIGAYSLALHLMPSLKAWLVIPLIIGSAIGLCLTFAGSKYWAFRHHA